MRQPSAAQAQPQVRSVSRSACQPVDSFTSSVKSPRLPKRIRLVTHVSLSAFLARPCVFP
jgi:hypothetical protein